MKPQFFKTKRIIDRLDIMVDNAIEGRNLESRFDESRMGALETKLQKFLEMNNRSIDGLREEKAKINTLISDISHQTKTPIANIKLYAELLRESDISEENREYVNVLIEQTERLNFLIQSLIKISRLDNGIITLTPKNQTIVSLLEAAKKTYFLAASEKNIDIDITVNEVEAVFDEKWTAEAIEIILDNAIKYTPNNGKISINIEEYQMFLRINIKDTGIGIKEDEYSKIFMRFYRSSDVAEKPGVGIGLYLAREIVTKENGYITVSSDYGKWTVFSIYLPKN